jgi:iron complex outermembrane receptor protein
MFRPSPASRTCAAVVGVCACLSATAAGAAAPQEGPQVSDLVGMDLEQLMQIEVGQVVGASRREQSVHDAPSSVTVLTAAQIRDHGYRTLAEALRSVPGLHVTNDRNYSYLAVRGFYVPGDYNSRVLVLVDGHRLNYGVYGGASLGYEAPVDVASLERIEVIRGPGSSLYGSNAFFAVVNLVTKKGGAAQGLTVDAEAGEWDTYLGRVTWGSKFGDGSELFLSARAYTSDGSALFYEDYASGPWGGITRHGDYERAQQLQARWDSGPWSVSAGFAWREKGLPTGAFGTVFETDANRTIDAQGYFDVGWKSASDDGRTTQANLRYDDYYYTGRYIYDDTGSGGPPDLDYRDRTTARTLSAEALHSMPGKWKDRLTFGAEVRFNFQADQYNEDNFYGELLDDRRDNLNGGVFAQDEIELGESTTLVLGGRFDHYEWFGGVFTPRLALVRHLGEHATAKLLYGEAYRAPTEYELYYGDGTTQLGNDDLDPERIRTLEGILATKLGAGLEGSISVFHNELDDMIVLAPGAGGVLAFENADASEADGVEVELVKHWRQGTRLRVSHSYQEVVDEASGSRLPNAPRQLSQAVFEAPLFTPRLRAGLELIHVGSRVTLSGGKTDAYVLTNLVVRALDIAPGVEFYVRAMNLFDVSYEDPVSAELVQDALGQDGLRVTFGLRLSR